jgi:Domain of unknown function (DUF1707)
MRANQAAGQLRVGDAEREAAVAALGDHYAAGRLTLEEHDDRTTRAYAARVAADLWPLFNDLPQAAPPRDDRRAHRAPGVAPLLLVVIGLVVLTQLPWPILLVVGWIWWGRVFRRWTRGPVGAAGAWRCYSMGSRRAVRGTWS